MGDQIWLAGSAVADVLIAASMLYFVRSFSFLADLVPPPEVRHLEQLVLAKKNSMWNNGRSPNRRITKLIRCTVETGVLSAAAASLDLGLYLGFNHNNLHAAVYVRPACSPPPPCFCSEKLLIWLLAHTARWCYPSYTAMHSWRRSILEGVYTSVQCHPPRVTPRSRQEDGLTRSSSHLWVSR